MIPFDLPPKPKLWTPPKPAIIRAASLDDMKLALPIMGAFASAAARGLRATILDLGALSQITDYTGASYFGDMTGGGGNAAAFDGNTNQAHSAGARINANVASSYVGVAWPASKRIGRVKVYAPNNEGYTGSSVSFEVYGKNGSPSSSTDGTLLRSAQAAADSASASVSDDITTGFDTSTKYTNTWVRAVMSPSSEIKIVEVQFFGYAN